jgi:hypothetical protein
MSFVGYGIPLLVHPLTSFDAFTSSLLNPVTTLFLQFQYSYGNASDYFSSILNVLVDVA